MCRTVNMIAQNAFSVCQDGAGTAIRDNCRHDGIAFLIWHFVLMACNAPATEMRGAFILLLHLPSFSLIAVLLSWTFNCSYFGPSNSCSKCLAGISSIFPRQREKKCIRSFVQYGRMSFGHMWFEEPKV